MAALSPIGRALAIARAGKTPPRPGPARMRPPSTRLVEREYAKRLRALVHAWSDHVETLVRSELRHDALSDDLERAWRRLVDASGIEAWLTRTGRELGGQQARYLERVAGVPINSVANQSVLEAFRNENLDYIVSLPKSQLPKIADIVRPAQAGGQRWEDIADEIEARLGVTRNRARLIARDQTNKFNAQLTQATQEAVGVEEYVWTTANDYAVRGRPGGEYEDSEDNHWVLHGKTFRWDNPPIVNKTTGERAHPGVAIQCRCQAVPVVPYFGAPPTLARNPEIAAQEERLRREGRIGRLAREREDPPQRRAAPLGGQWGVYIIFPNGAEKLWSTSDDPALAAKKAAIWNAKRPRDRENSNAVVRRR